MYIGKEPIVGNFQKCDAITVVNGQAAYTLQVGGTNVVPESANHMLVSLNGILQAPVTSFTVSGSTLTFASNLATGDVIDFVILLGNVLDLGVPSDASITNAKLASDIISGETDIGGAIADADLFLLDDGAGGTLRKTAASRIKTYVGGGITNSQVWLLTSDQALTGSSSMADITANLAESGITGYARIGDAMTVSSGVFTFPSTGIWTVEAIFNFVGSDGYCQGRIQATTNNSSYSDVSLSSEETDNQEYANAFLKAQVDVTDTANVKVKFGQGGTISGNALKGSSSYMRTGFFFTRIGDT